MFRNQHGDLSIARLILLCIPILVILMFASCSFTKVGQGHVGVKVNNIGSGAGVSKKSLGVGWYFTPPGVTIYEYPIFTNNATWQEIRFQDKNGLSVDAPVSIAYRADSRLAPVLFQKYRTDMDGILNGPVYNTIRNAIVTEASELTVDQIYGPHKAVLIENARIRADKYLEPFGLHIEQLFWAGNINLPGSIQNQINARVANEQAAIAEQAKVAKVEAQARAAVAKAEGEAKAAQILGEALRANPQSLESKKLEKWDGHLPRVIAGGNSPIMINGN
jgi:regulator of protease activity HflC (stomatin/prohibitin superfamily)